jgi:hypothetical protein
MLVCKVMLSEDHELTHDIRLELNAVKRCLLSIMRKQEIAVCALVRGWAYAQSECLAEA